MCGHLALAGGFCVPESLKRECGKNISLWVQVCGQDLHICPPDGEEMERFHPTLHADEQYGVQEQPKTVYP